VAKVENLTVMSSDLSGMREIFQMQPSSSGYLVSDYTAMLVTTVFACLSKISGAVQQLPIHEYQTGENGDRELVTPASPLWWLLNESPAAQWTAASWKEWIAHCVHLRGDQVTQILRAGAPSAGGKPVGLRPFHPDWVRTRPYVSPEGELRNAYDVFHPYLNQSYTLDQDDVLHFSGYGFNGLRSLSVIQHAARSAIGNELAASDYMGKSVGAGSMPKIALTYPNTLKPDQAELLRKSFVATYGNGPTQQMMPLVLTEGGTATPLTISPIDMQLLESRKLTRGQICEAFGVPPVMIGDQEKATSWGTGVEQITLGFVKYTLQPHLVRWSEEMNRKLYRRAGRFVDFDLDALLAGDSKGQAEAFRFALGGPGSGDGWMSINEVRRLKNQKSLGPEYDKPFRAQRGTTQPKDPGATA
jgi:HK97 family phage portal protein